jgi:hypothetical protein
MNFKEGVDPHDLSKFQPATWILWSATILYCEEFKLPLTITSLISDRDGIKTVSNSHQEGRAFDIRTAGWTEQSIHRFCFIMNRNYRDIAAISASDGVERAAVYHNNHIHMQVRPNVSVNKFI